MAEMRPANSAPNVNGNGGWFWYFPWACRIYAYTHFRRALAGEMKETYVEEVQPGAVHIHQYFILSRRWLGCVVDDGNLGGVSVRPDNCGSHCLCVTGVSREREREGASGEHDDGCAPANKEMAAYPASLGFRSEYNVPDPGHPATSPISSSTNDQGRSRFRKCKIVVSRCDAYVHDINAARSKSWFKFILLLFFLPHVPTMAHAKPNPSPPS